MKESSLISSKRLLDYYFDAFARRDLEHIAKCLSDDVTLQDPFENRRGNTDVLAVYASIFNKHQELKVEIKRVYFQSDTSIAAEFTIRAVTTEGVSLVIDGIDCIELKDSKITSLRAYLDIK